MCSYIKSVVSYLVWSGLLCFIIFHTHTYGMHMSHNSCELCIILEYIWKFSDYIDIENTFEFGHTLVEILQMSEWKKKCVGLQRTLGNKRTVHHNHIQFYWFYLSKNACCIKLSCPVVLTFTLESELLWQLTFAFVATYANFIYNPK